MTTRWAFSFLILACIGPMIGCGEKVKDVERGDPNSPDYVVKPDAEAFGNRYAGSPLDPNPPKKDKKK